jgi:hypothetical protein
MMRIPKETIRDEAREVEKRIPRKQSQKPKLQPSKWSKQTTTLKDDW